MEKDDDLLIKYVSVDILQAEVVVLRDVNLEVRKGEFIYLIGRVGSGKSTLLKSFYSEVPIAGGAEARIFDYDLQRLKRRNVPYLRRRLGIIYQDFQLLIDRTVHDNLSFVLRATGWNKTEDIENRITEVLQRVGMENKGYKMPHQLSGGEQQRIVIARALLNSPDIILADEPTGNLDHETGVDILELLRSIQEQGTTIIMSTHNMAWLKLYPGRVINFGEEHMWEGDKPDFHKLELEKKAAEEKEVKEQRLVEEQKQQEQEDVKGAKKNKKKSKKDESQTNDGAVIEETSAVEAVVEQEEPAELSVEDVAPSMKVEENNLEKPKAIRTRRTTSTVAKKKKATKTVDAEDKPKVKRVPRKPKVTAQKQTKPLEDKAESPAK